MSCRGFLAGLLLGIRRRLTTARQKSRDLPKLWRANFLFAVVYVCPVWKCLLTIAPLELEIEHVRAALGLAALICTVRQRASFVKFPWLRRSVRNCVNKDPYESLSDAEGKPWGRWSSDLCTSHFFLS